MKLATTRAPGGLKPTLRGDRYGPEPEGLEELRAAWDEVVAARDRLFALLARDGDPYETWRRAMGDEMLAHIAFVELAKDVANRAYGRVTDVPAEEPVIPPRRKAQASRRCCWSR